MTDAPIENAGRLADDQRRITDRLQRDEIVKNSLPGTTPARKMETPEPLGRDVSLDEMASINAQSMQDLGKIYTGVRYLRYLDGEKHLLFVSPSGIFLPRPKTTAVWPRLRPTRAWLSTSFTPAARPGWRSTGGA